MRNSIQSIFLLGVMAIFLLGCEGKIEQSKIQTVKIYGNCEMCKETIEKAAFKNKEAKVDWNVDSKMATITFDSTQTTLDVILKKIAHAGYDSDAHTAPLESYKKLHECCQYKRKAE